MYPLNHALALIKSFEHCSLVPYREPNGTWSIGYGHNIEPQEKFGTITRAEAVSILEGDIERYANAVDSVIRVPITAEIFTALVDFTYNEGIGHFITSTLIEKLNAGDYAGAARELVYQNADGTLHGWIFATVKGVKVIMPGLVERRRIEQELFLSNIPNLSRGI